MIRVEIKIIPFRKGALPLNTNHFKQLRSILCIALIACYFIGLLCMFFNATSAGIALWVISTVGGFLTLHFIRQKEEREALEAEKKEHQDGDDDTCE